ncbi:hypothetical protein [uncultured Corynebacterium sp.]|uniref:hypothetical protein n=1 Tax=uncultured Corynebacterium sp. TaxID=159447 RepID=UPI0025F58970|nr:hypothetical protein [uncultured Corynebacterium sp.]
MKTRGSAVALIAAALMLVGCGADEPGDGGESSSSASTSSSSSSSSSSSTSSTSASSTTSAEPVAAEPHFVECVYGGGSWTGTAEYSDGSYGPHPDCQALLDQQVAENPYVCPQTDWRVPDLSWCSDPSRGGLHTPGAGRNAPDPAWTGVPDPVDPTYDSSGEAQSHHGCQQGYIDDPALCGEMEQKYG